MELRAFVEAVRTRSAPVVCGQDGKKALDMALRINREIEKNLKSAAQFPGASEFLKELPGHHLPPENLIKVPDIKKICIIAGEASGDLHWGFAGQGLEAIG